MSDQITAPDVMAVNELQRERIAKLEQSLTECQRDFQELKAENAQLKRSLEFIRDVIGLSKTGMRAIARNALKHEINRLCDYIDGPAPTTYRIVGVLTQEDCKILRALMGRAVYAGIAEKLIGMVQESTVDEPIEWRTLELGWVRIDEAEAKIREARGE